MVYYAQLRRSVAYADALAPAMHGSAKLRTEA
jgi:hypothetical protein